MKDMSTDMIKKVYALTKGQVTIIGVGGVGTGQDAYDKIKAGASLVEMYSRLSMEGPWSPPKIKIELRRCLIYMYVYMYIELRRCLGLRAGQVGACFALESPHIHIFALQCARARTHAHTHTTHTQVASGRWV